MHLALPNTPHTLSLHVSNAATSTLQGLARGGDTRRYGFEFTIPVHVARFFANPEARTAATEPPTVVSPAMRDSATSISVATVVTPEPSPTTPAASSLVTSPDTSAAPASAPRPASAASAPRVAPKVLIARMKGQAYVPEHIEVAAETTVEWKNLDALIHTVTAVDKSFNSGVIAADGNYSHLFSKPGTYAIYCMAHPFMKGTVVVK